MKKQFLLLSLLAAGYVAPAQLFNKTYSSTYIYVSPPIAEKCIKTVADNAPGHTAMLLAAPIDQNSICLRIIDASGTVVANFHWASDNGMYTSSISPTDMLVAPNGDFIIVGYYKRGDNPGSNYYSVYTNPFAMRVDRTGHVFWIREYRVNEDNTYHYQGARKPKVNITRITDEPDDYIIAAAGEPAFPSTALNDVAIDGIRIQGSDGLFGTAGWHNKYQYATTPPPVRADLIDESMPLSMAYGNGICLIAGEQDGANATYLSYNGFYMGIDKTGALVTPVNNYAVMGNYQAFDHNVIYDNTTSQFIISYNTPNTVLAPWPGVPIGTSGIGLLKLDGTTLAEMDDNIYYPTSGLTGLQGSQTGLTTNVAEDQYILATELLPLEGGAYIPNPGMLSIDKATGSIFSWNRYNVNRSVSTNPAIARVIKSGLETYNITGTVFNGPGMTPGLRLISDVEPATAGVCGLDPVTPNLFPALIPPSIYTYIAVPTSPEIPRIGLRAEIITSISTDCTSFPSPSDYRLTKAAPGLQLYPTLLQEGMQDLKITLTADKASRLNVSLMTIDGKVIVTQHYNFATGSQDMNWHIPVLAPGAYIVHMRSDNGAFSQRVRMTQL